MGRKQLLVIQSAKQVTGHSLSIERAVSPAGKDVDGGLLHGVTLIISRRHVQRLRFWIPARSGGNDDVGLLADERLASVSPTVKMSLVAHHKA